VASVFISYRHESVAHRKCVLQLAERLRDEELNTGVRVVLDEFVSGGPPQGWIRWGVEQASSADKVLIIASAGWFRAYQGKELPGKGLYAANEGRMIQQRIFESNGVNHDVRVVSFKPADTRSIPPDLKSYHRFNMPRGFADLLAWLKGTDLAPASSPLGAQNNWLRRAPKIQDWPFADCDEVRAAFARLLTTKPGQRVLRMSGPSECGKTELTTHMQGLATASPWLACGRLDFKAGPDLDPEFRRFVAGLDVDNAVRTSEGKPTQARLEAALRALHDRARPTLLIFDSYDKAGEYAQWMRGRLVPQAKGMPWLRVVVAGQSFPDDVGGSWAEASELVELRTLGWRDWHDFGRRYWAGLDEDFTQKLYGQLVGRHNLLRAVLGPR
jgi:hypothetical protein